MPARSHVAAQVPGRRPARFLAVALALVAASVALPACGAAGHEHGQPGPSGAAAAEAVPPSAGRSTVPVPAPTSGQGQGFATDHLDHGAMPGSEDGAMTGSEHEHATGASSAGPTSRPRGVTLAGFGVVNGLVLVAAAIVRRRTRRTRGEFEQHRARRTEMTA